MAHVGETPVLGSVLKQVAEFLVQASARFWRHDGVGARLHDQHAGAGGQPWWQPRGGDQALEIGSQPLPPCSCQALRARTRWQRADIRGGGSALQECVQHRGFARTTDGASHPFKPSPQRTALPSFRNKTPEAGQEDNICGLGQHGGLQQVRSKGVGDHRPSLRRRRIGLLTPDRRVRTAAAIATFSTDPVPSMRLEGALPGGPDGSIRAPAMHRDDLIHERRGPGPRDVSKACRA